MPTTDKYLDQAIMQRLSYIVQTLFKKEQILSAYSADLRMDDNFVLTFSLYNREGEAILNKSIDLPLEDMIIDGWYDEDTKKIVLVLKSGTRIEFSVADLVSGLQSEITPENKLDSDLVNDVNQAHKFTTFADIQKLAGIEPGAQVNLPPVETEENKLKVHKIDKAEPLITIEGVDYYHKCEFNLYQMYHNEQNIYKNILTNEIISINDYPKIFGCPPGPGGVYLEVADSQTGVWRVHLYSELTEITYTSHAFTVVQNQIEVTDNTKICLPGCTSYYGLLSEDGKTFTSYWTEQKDLIINPITKITDGINTIDIHDSRLPNAGTAGKFLKDDYTWDTVDALPDRTSAQVNDVLKLDNNKEPIWSAEEKELPSTFSAEQGQALILNSNKEPIWDNISVGGLQVLELSSIEGILTDEQIELIKSDNCVIKYDLDIFYKGDWSGNDQWYYYYTPRLYVSASTNLWEIGNYYVSIDTHTKEYIINGGIGAQIERVKANQSLSGSEINLTSLKIGSTNYKISTEILIETTYANLKSLRDNYQLKPGMWYRITDYSCTTSTSNTSSAGHQFDIIVLATDANKLSEEARAIQHSGDTYFANNNLAAWKIWYCLDNSSTRFEWADSTNGKGVIYRMIDEFGNDCPYDFKNILFTGGVSFGSITYTNAYTFSYTFNNTILDASCLSTKRCYNNIIKTYFEMYNVPSFTNRYVLPWIIFISNDESFDCYYNIFNSNCSYITVRKNSYANTFEAQCTQIELNQDCYDNIFKQGCNSIYLNHGCMRNIFDIASQGITFGSYCENNNIGINCSNIKLGNNFRNIIIGNSCLDICFGVSTSKPIDYCTRITIDSDCRCLYIISNDTDASFNNYLQNIHIHSGIWGPSPNRLTISVPDRNLQYTTEYYSNNSREVILGGNE